MLRPFRVENLHGPEGVERDQEDKVVRLTAPTYDATISSNPRASLKYDDEEGDEVTVGSSLELEDRLSEASLQTPRIPIIPGSATARVARSVTRLPEFHIGDQEDVQAVWNSLQLKSTPDHGATTTNNESEPPSPSTASSTHKEPSNQLEDHRKLYFNTTNPPLLSRHTLGETIKEYTKTSTESSSSTDAKLTPEGRRQARSAGFRLRARGPSLQPAFATIAPSDRSSHHSRWASYQNGATSNAFSAPEMSPTACDRQGQDSSTMMDPQMPPVEPITGERGNDDTDLQGVLDQAWDRLSDDCTPSNATGKRGSAILDIPAMPQKPLLELFEAELANKAKSRSSNLLEAETQLRAFMSEDRLFGPTMSASTKSPKLDCQPESSEVNSTSSEHTCPAPLLEMNTRLCPDSPRPVEEAIRTTVAGFEACLRGLIDALQPHSPASRPVTQVRDDALLTIQKLAEVLTTPKIDDHQNSQHRPSEKTASPHQCSQEETKQTLDLERGDAVQITSGPAIVTDSEAYPLKDSDVEQESRSSCSLEDSSPNPWNAKPKETRPTGGERMRYSGSALDLSGPFRYHGPGPIHLPPYSTRCGAKRASSLRHLPKAEDASHLRRFQSTRFERKLQHQGDDTRPRNHATKEVRAMNPFAFPAVTTRFPTVAQFERSNHLQNSSQPNLIDLEETPDNARVQGAAASSSQSNMHAAHGDRKSPGAIEEGSSHDAQEVTRTQAEARHSNLDREGEDDRLNTQRKHQSLNGMAFDTNVSTEVEPENGHEESAFSSRNFAPNAAQSIQAGQSRNAPPIPIETHIRERSEDAERPPQAVPRYKHAMDPSSLGSDAARLTCPFNAFEPSAVAEAHPFSNVRRSATIADLRHAPSARPRRPHSERYNPDYPVLPSRLEGISDRQPRRPTRPLRNHWSPAVQFPPPAPLVSRNQTVNPRVPAPQSQAITHAQQHSFPNAALQAEIDSCVKQLLNLGFGHLAQDRLLMYAEATKGDLVESLDMISEDQRAEDIRRSIESGAERDL